VVKTELKENMENQGNIFFTPLLEDLLQQDKLIQVSLSGLSMFPFLMHGDVVQIQSVTNKKIKRGAIVIYKNKERWIAHRLIKTDVKKNLIYTRGDSRTVKDEPIIPEQIKGVVVKIVKSRWILAHLSIGKFAKVITFFSPVMAPVFGFIFFLLGKLKICIG